MSHFDRSLGSHPFGPPKAGATTITTAPSAKFDGAPASSEDVRAKEKELASREMSVKMREEELARKESALGIKAPNFPPLFPLVYHDIAEEIPEYAHYIQRPAFFSWLGIILCLLCNFLAVVIAWIAGALGGAGVGSFFVSLVLLVLGVPLSFLLWYRRLYNALKKDSGVGMGVFFLGYGLHIVFCCYCSVAPPFLFSGYGIAGVMTAVSNITSGNFVGGIVYVIVAALFILESLLSFYVFGQAFAYFRGSGKGNQAKRELAMSAISSAAARV